MVDWFRLAVPNGLIFHCPNGGLRTKSEAARLKWMGVLPGVTDLIIVDEHGLFHAIEVKTPDGVLSPSQIEFRDLCRKRHWPWAICHNVTEFDRQLEAWGFQRRGRVV